MPCKNAARDRPLTKYRRVPESVTVPLFSDNSQIPLPARYPAQAVMVGDREYDILGARKLGLDSVGVLYGYGSRQELEDAGATYLAERVEDLLAVL